MIHIPLQLKARIFLGNSLYLKWIVIHFYYQRVALMLAHATFDGLITLYLWILFLQKQYSGKLEEVLNFL